MTHTANNELKPGDWIGAEYRVRRVLGGAGKSGMGAVYLVDGRSSEEPFVLKTYQQSGSRDELARRFEREAKTWVGLGKHPNMVHCFWAKRFEKQLFVAAEYVWPTPDGKNTIGHHLTSGKIPLEQQIRWIAEFCFGMRHAVSRGVVAHRDIKPANLMIDGEGRLKITDFGLVREVVTERRERGERCGASKGVDLTRFDSGMGTPPFMPPEQFVRAASVDCRADIYAFGIVAFMMATGGQHPFGWDVSDWRAAHLMSKVGRTGSPIDPLLDRCLRKDPKDRYQSVSEMLADLLAISKRTRVSIPEEESDRDGEFAGEYSAAQTLRNEGRLEEAVQRLAKMAKRWPRRSEVHTELGAIYLAKAHWSSAEDACRKSLGLCATSTAAWNNLGAALANQRRLDEAREAFGQAIHIDPENTGALISLAHIHVKEGDWATARQLADVAVFWRPEKIAALQIAAEGAAREKDYARWAELMEQVVRIQPSIAKHWYNLSLAYRSLNQVERQLGALDRVLDMDPKDGEALVEKVQALSGEGRFQEALSVSDTLRGLPGWDAASASMRAQIYAAMGDPMSGYLVLKKALERNERHAGLWFTMALLLRTNPQYSQQAIAAVRNGLLAARENPRSIASENLAALQGLARELGA